MPEHRITREIWIFLGLATIPILYLFHEAITQGSVLGQATLLYQYLPWSAHTPGEIRANNRLLWDVPTAFYPMLQHARTSVLSGHLPTWMAAAGSGVPILAGFQSAVLSPLTWPVFLVPFPHGLVLTAIARLVLGGLGMFVFLRTMPLSRQASLFGAAAFMLNSFSIVWLEHPMSAVAAWLPWLLIGVVPVCEADARAIAVFGLISACAPGGHPETAFKLFLFAGAYAVFRGSAARRRAPSRPRGRWHPGPARGLLQVLPFLNTCARAASSNCGKACRAPCSPTRLHPW